jgi:long-chain acyl-CoA synthetase
MPAVPLPVQFFERARAHPDAVALRRKQLGLWQELSWRDYEAGVLAVASALLALGLRPGEPVGLIGENRVEWLLSDLGILAAGGVTCAMYTTSAVAQVEYILGHSGARLLIAENEEQLEAPNSAKRTARAHHRDRRQGSVAIGTRR